MLATDKAIIVEGKYDKIRLSRLVDAVIICTDGFGIFKNKEKMQLISHYARTTGIIILTDSDRAGFVIRNHIKGTIPDADENKIQNVYIPDVFGKERRKDHPSKEGKLGVEGIDDEILINILSKVISSDTRSLPRDIDKLLFMDLGLTGGADSSEKRRMILKAYGLPQRLTTNAMIDLLNTFTDKQSFTETARRVLSET